MVTTILQIVLVFLLLPNLIPSLDLPTNLFDYETDNFTDSLLHNKFFVDKSLLVEEFLQHNGSVLAVVVVRPKGWGKSINLHMLEKFFEIEVDEKGNPLPKNKTINDKLFLGGTVVLSSNETKHLEPLKIAKSSNATKHLGKHPIMLLELKNATGQNFTEIETKIKSCVVQAFERHKYLIHSTKITNMEKFQKYLKGGFNFEELQRSLHFLGLKLREHFGQDVFVLVDDYDIPLVSAYLEFKKNSQDSKKVVELLRYMLSAARKRTDKLISDMAPGINAETTTQHDTLNTTLQNGSTPTQDNTLNTAFVTGVLDLIFENVEEQRFLQFVKVHTLFDAPFSKFYGFTDNEVQNLLTKVPEGQVDPHLLKLWYNGYYYEFRRSKELHFYKSISIIRCLYANGLEFPYYPNELDNKLIHKILSSDEMQAFVHLVIASRSKWIGPYTYITSPIRWKRSIEDVLSDNMTILIFNGFLSLGKPNIAGYGDPNIGIPNREMRRVYEINLMRWVYKKFNTDASIFFSFAGLLYTGLKIDFAESLREYISKASAFIRSSEYNAKISYDGLMLALKTTITELAHEAQDEKENGDIRDINDILLTPLKHMSTIAIAIRYKVIKDEKNLTSVAEAELEQINQEYVNGTVLETRYPRVTKCFKVGIAFCGDKVEVRFEISQRMNLTTTPAQP